MFPSKAPRNQRGSKGFTLVELMVTLVILSAVLVTVTLIDDGPVVMRLLRQFDHRPNVASDGIFLTPRSWFGEFQRRAHSKTAVQRRLSVCRPS